MVHQSEGAQRSIQYEGKYHKVMSIEKDAKDRDVYVLEGGLRLTSVDGLLIDEPFSTEIKPGEVDLTDKLAQFPKLGLTEGHGWQYYLGELNQAKLRSEFRTGNPILLIRMRNDDERTVGQNNQRVSPGQPHYQELLDLLRSK